MRGARRGTTLKPPSDGLAVRIPALVLVVLLAGCSTGGSPQDEATSVTSTSTAQALDELANVTPLGLTDTFYLLRTPDLNVTLPDNETTLAVKGAYGAQTFVWNRTLNSSGNLTGGHLRLWLLLPRSAVQQGTANDPGCTVHWLAQVVWNETTRNLEGGCGSIGSGTIPPGDYAVNVTAPPPGNAIEFGPGANLRIQATVGLVQPQGNAVYLMGGNARYDSHVTLAGLEEPAVDPLPALPDPDAA